MIIDKENSRLKFSGFGQTSRINIRWVLTSLISTALNGSRQVTEAGVMVTSAKIDAHGQCGHIGGPLVYKMYLKKHERGGGQEVKEVNTEVNLSEATNMYVSRPNSDRFWHR